MQIIVRTDKNIDGPDKFATWAEAEVAHILAPFASKLTRVEVHLKDERAGSTDGQDITCLVEARVAGLQPMTATDRAGNPGDALKGATVKMKRVLDTAIGKLQTHKGTAPPPVDDDA